MLQTIAKDSLLQAKQQLKSNRAKKSHKALIKKEWRVERRWLLATSKTLTRNTFDISLRNFASSTFAWGLITSVTFAWDLWIFGMWTFAFGSSAYELK